jgi:hypothetical protein
VGNIPLNHFIGVNNPHSCVGVEPRYMGISPIYAIPKILSQVGLTKEDVDIYEVRSLNCRRCITTGFSPDQ